MIRRIMIIEKIVGYTETSKLSSSPKIVARMRNDIDWEI